MVRTQEVSDSRVTESHAELQQEQKQGRRGREEGRKGEYVQLEVMVRTQEVRDSRVIDSHAEL